MCGIAGFVSKSQRFTRDILQCMADALTHRGPDDCGVKLWNRAEKGFPTAEVEGCAGLAHRRLSIIDLSDAGHQPMSNESGDIWIVYNGEFYNFGDYREELEKAGHRFRSRCDTETILHLYEEYGMEETLRRMNGMFAFALLDHRSGNLWLARDRAGQKPLYYVVHEDTLFFASEIKALVAAGKVDVRDLDEEALDQFWTFGYTTGGRTIYRAVRQLPPAHYANWSKGGLRIQPYWKCPFGRTEQSRAGHRERLDELDSLLADSIRLRMISDRPVGLFLSGGIDSSLIAAVTAKKLSQPLRAFTVSFREDGFDESKYAATIAQKLDLEHEILPADDAQVDFEGIVRHFDEPFGDASAIPTYLLARAARKRVVVALTGDAGDELFGGYSEYREGLRLWGPAGRVPESDGFRLKDWLRELRLRMCGPQTGYSLMQRHVNSRHRRRLYGERLRASASFDSTCLARARLMNEIADSDVLTKMQYADFHMYLPDDVLVKMDRMSMAHALECRNPFLDYRIIEFAASVPPAERVDVDGRGKSILRSLLARYLPEELFERPKAGFTPPWTRWCAGAFRAALADKWRELAPPLFREDAADWLIPLEGDANAVWLWQAFSMVKFLAYRQEERKDPRIDAN